MSAPFLFYLPNVSAPPLISVVALLTILRGARTTGGVPWPVRFAALLSLLSVAALRWSPNTNAALDAALYFAELAGLILVGFRIGPRSANLTTLVSAWTVASGADALLVIYFRLRPGDELAWFHSSLASVFIPGGTLRALFSTSPDNALSPDKAGALFVNANAGSAFLGVAFLAAVFLWRRTSRRIWLVPAALYALAIVASGSTTGISLLLLLSALLVTARVHGPALRMVLVLTGGAGVAVSLYAAGPVIAGGYDVSVRQALWGPAAQAIASHPVLGLGYGGWEIYSASLFPLLASVTLPPHNLVLYTGVELGLPGVLCLVGFWIATAWRLSRCPFAGRGLVVAAAGWTVLHSMGDNTTVFNDFHTMPVLAVLVGAYLVTGPGTAAGHAAGHAALSGRPRLRVTAARVVRMSRPMMAWWCPLQFATSEVAHPRPTPAGAVSFAAKINSP